MTGSSGQPNEPPILLQPPFCRGDVLADIILAIHAEDCRAVFLTSDSGLGASTILQELAKATSNQVPVLTIHGTKSLEKIPYGVLARFLTGVDPATGDFRISVLRGILTELDELRQADATEHSGSDASNLPLIIIDDAHSVDSATAEVAVNLVMSGAVNLVVSHSSMHDLPAPLPKLWATGMAENIVLLPLNQAEGHAFCEALLGGRVMASSSWHYWSRSAGNPLFLRLLVTESVERGWLRKVRGMWVADLDQETPTRGLSEAVGAVLRGLSAGGQESLNLIALAEPVSESSLRGLISPTVIRELLDWRVVKYQGSEPEMLVLANPIYGEVIRNMVPVSQSRRLHEQLIGRFDPASVSGEALLRRVLWSLEIGVEVPEATLLSAAIFASKLFQSSTAWELADCIHGELYKLRATMVKARARYNVGDYEGAFIHMESVREDVDNLEDLLFGSLLRASTKSALGMSVTAVLEDAKALRESGEQLALANPDSAETIRAHSESGAILVELLALSRSGHYSKMTDLTAGLMSAEGLSVASAKLHRAMVLTMESERLTAQGYPHQGMQRAAEAYAIEHSDEHDVFFLPESILLRQLAAALCSGDWNTTDMILKEFFLEAGPAGFSFGGGANVVRGIAALRGGRIVDALEELMRGIEALKISDPQQLLGFCTAMAAYAAARMAKPDVALSLLEEHTESTGMFLVVAHERAYVTAARHILTPDAGALDELVAQADAARADGSAMLELNALVLAMELGAENLAARVADVAQAVEGPWAQSLAFYASALDKNDGAALTQAGELLAAAGLLGFAKQALSKSASLSDGGSSGRKAIKARRAMRKISALIAPGTESPNGFPQLTRREGEVARLAAAGMSDRDIAEHLTVALRTVEGHLYRTYTKLGISAREELAEELEREPRHH